jgi:hypothetical protein
MDPDADLGRPHAAPTGTAGTLVGIWSGLDLIVELTVIVLASWVNALLVFIVALAVLIAVNAACCGWIESHWEGWIGGPTGARIRRRLDSTAPWHLIRHSATWIERGSDGWFGLATLLTNAVTAVTVAHLTGGGPVGRRRVVVATLSHSLLIAGVGAVAGFVLGEAVSAV